MPRDPSQDSVLHAAPQSGVWTAFILPPHRAERSGPVSSARCVQVFHQCFKSRWWGPWAGFFQAICGPFAARDNKSQRTWLTGRWARRKTNMTLIPKTVESWVLDMLSLTGSWAGISCLIKAALASNNSSCRLTMLLPSKGRTQTSVQPARALWCVDPWSLSDWSLGSPPHTLTQT